MHKKMRKGLWGGVGTLATLLLGWGVLRLIDGKLPVPVAVSFLIVGVGLFVLSYLFRDQWRNGNGNPLR
jgi:hypothetical protein